MSRYHWFLAGAFLVAWILSAIDPVYREGWALENVLVLAFIPVVLVVGRYFKLSDTSYTFITLFLILHIIGSHWTYGEVPFGYWLQEVFGSDRNIYDRLVHFSFGFLMAYPIREVFVRVTGAKGFWSYYFPVDIVLSLSALYELGEWIIATTVAGEQLGLAFLGVQGDVWDAQKDMALATLGSIVSMLIVLFLRWYLHEDTPGEIRESLRIKPDAPVDARGLRRVIR